MFIFYICVQLFQSSVHYSRSGPVFQLDSAPTHDPNDPHNHQGLRGHTPQSVGGDTVESFDDMMTRRRPLPGILGIVTIRVFFVIKINKYC